MAFVIPSAEQIRRSADKQYNIGRSLFFNLKERSSFILQAMFNLFNPYTFEDENLINDLVAKIARVIGGTSGIGVESGKGGAPAAGGYQGEGKGYVEVMKTNTDSLES